MKLHPVRILILTAVLVVGTTISAPALSCRGSFLGCRSHAQKVSFCRASCRTRRNLCTTMFRKTGGLRKRCYDVMVSTCIGQGGVCGRGCGTRNPCPAGQQCVLGQCILKAPDRCGTGVCPANFPNCGPDGRCWTKPCATLCAGGGCCSPDFPVCGGDGLCHPGSTGGGGGGAGGVPTNLPPGNYTVTLCVSGAISLPCQPVETIPLTSISQFQAALDTATNQWLAATANLPDCTRGATTYSAFNGSSFTASFTATCSSPAGSVSETMDITVRLD